MEEDDFNSHEDIEISEESRTRSLIDKKLK
jgi:hypothetical protein